MEAFVLLNSDCISSDHFLKTGYTPTLIPLLLLLRSVLIPLYIYHGLFPSA